MSKIAQDMVLVILVLAGIVSFFFNPLGENMEYLRIIMAAIVGFLIKEPIITRQVPVLRARRK